MTTQDHEGMTPITIPLGATNTKIPKGEPITINHDKGRITIFEITSLVLYLVSMDIILIIAHKFLISNR
jgi:hypothetical protein